MFVMSEDVFCWFNLCEGVFWIAIAVGLVLICWHRRKDIDLTLIAALLFVAFGVSDFVEVTTGGWYKPWWLCLCNAGCVVGLLAVYILHQRRRHRVAAQNTQRKTDVC